MSGDPRLTPEVVAELLRLFSYQLPWWLLLHALLTLHAATNWGKWGWAMVRLPGFLLMFILASAFTQGELARELGPIDPALSGSGAAADGRDPGGTLPSEPAGTPGPGPAGAP
jgi:hypothetical protein